MPKKKILNLKAEKKLKKRTDKEGFGKNIKDKKCPVKKIQSRKRQS